MLPLAALLHIPTAAVGWAAGAANTIRQRMPARRVFGALCKKGAESSLYIRNMENATGTFTSPAAKTSVTTRRAPDLHWQNIAYVMARSDVLAANDAQAALVAVTGRPPLPITDPHEHFETWDEHALCVGGNQKAYWILSNATPSLVRMDENDPTYFEITQTGQRISIPPQGRCDFGLIYKGAHPTTGVTCFVIMGLGTLGTEAAGYFFRTHIKELGRRFGGAGFAVILEACLADGPQGARIVWSAPTPRRTWLRPLTNRKWRTLEKTQS